MQRIKAVTHAEGKAKELLDGVKKAMGSTPNIFTTFANAPAALENLSHRDSQNADFPHQKEFFLVTVLS